MNLPDPPEIQEIKNSLLTSGIPLEISVASKLSRGWNVVEGIPVLIKETDNASQPIRSESDVIARKFWDHHRNTPLMMDIVIECKYRHPNTNWIFFDSQKWKYPPPFYRYFICNFDKTHQRREHVNKIDKSLSQFLKSVKLKSRAIQIPGEKSKAFSRELVSESFEQVIEASANHIDENVTQVLNYARQKKTGPYLSLVLPVVVTTAKLWEFKGAPLESIPKLSSQNFEKFFHETNSVLFDYQLPHKLRFNDSALNQNSWWFIPIVQYAHLNKYITKIEKLVEAIFAAIFE